MYSVHCTDLLRVKYEFPYAREYKTHRLEDAAIYKTLLSKVCFKRLCIGYCLFHRLLYKNFDSEVIFLRNLLIQYVLLRIMVHYRSYSLLLSITGHTGLKVCVEKSLLHQKFRTKPRETHYILFVKKNKIPFEVWTHFFGDITAQQYRDLT